MSEQNLEIARRGYKAWNEGDSDWFRDTTTEDFEVRPVPELFPDIEEVYRGLDGWTRFWDVFRDAWSSIDIAIERIEAISDDDVFAIVRFDGIGRGSGAKVSLGFAHWLTFRDSLLARLVVESPEDGERRLEERRREARR